MAAPIDEPLFTMPIENERIGPGTFWATAFTTVGHAPPSPTDNRKRNAPRVKAPVANACNATASDHQST